MYPTLLYIHFGAVIPAKAGIQRRKTGFLVKPGMTNTVKKLMGHHTGLSGQGAQPRVGAASAEEPNQGLAATAARF